MCGRSAWFTIVSFEIASAPAPPGDDASACAFKSWLRTFGASGLLAALVGPDATLLGVLDATLLLVSSAAAAFVAAVEVGRL